MPKHHPRPAHDFTITSFAWDVEHEQIHRRAGFSEVSRDVLARRFWQFLRFIQQRGLTSRIVASSLEAISEQTILRNSDLTDGGFYFIQKYHGRWVSRTRKDRGEQKEEAFLEKWYETFQHPVV
jgi:hypothetical protein